MTRFEDTQLLEKFSELLLENQQEFPDNERPRKRQRIENSNQKASHKSLWGHLMATLGRYLAVPGEPSLGDIMNAVEYVVGASKSLFAANSHVGRHFQPCLKMTSAKLSPHS